MFGDMGKMMKQAKELKSKLKEAEKELLKLSIEGQSRNKLVRCIVDGKMNIKEIQIEQELVDKKDRSLLEKSVMEAVSVAINDAQSKAASSLSGLTGGLGLPGM